MVLIIFRRGRLAFSLGRTWEKMPRRPTFGRTRPLVEMNKMSVTNGASSSSSGEATPGSSQSPASEAASLSTAGALNGDTARSQRMTASEVNATQLTTGLLALVGSAATMGISPSFVRLTDVSPLASAFWRVCLALPFLWAWMKASEARERKVRQILGIEASAAPKDVASTLFGTPKSGGLFSLPTVLAGIAFAGDLMFWHLGVMGTTIANATFFATMAPVWVVVFGWLLLHQRVSRNVMIGILLCIAGGATLVADTMSVAPGQLLGDVFSIITGMFFGLYFLCVGSARGEKNAARVTFELSIVSAVLLFIAAWIYDGFTGGNLLPQSVNGWLVLLALAVISHTGGQGLLSVALGRLPTAFSALVIFLEAIFAATFAWMIFDEAVSAVQILGGVIILVGIWTARPKTEG